MSAARIPSSWALLLAILVMLVAPSVSNAHDGHGNPAAWHACDQLALGATCSFAGPENTIHRGTCRAAADELLCIRNRPIERGGPTTTEVVARSWSPPGSSGGVTTMFVVGLALVGLAALVGLGVGARRRAAQSG